MNDVGVLVSFRDQAEGRIGILVNRGREPRLHPRAQARHILAHALEQFGVGVVAGPIPRPVLDIFGLVVAIDFPFHDDQEIGLDGQMGAAQRFQQTGEVASGVDDPFGAAGLQLADEVLQGQRHGRIFKFGQQRAVEISGDEFYGHWRFRS